MEHLAIVIINVIALGISLLFIVGVFLMLREQDRVTRVLPRVSTIARRASNNPLLAPRHYAWEAMGAFNPAAVLHNGVTHLFYRALGSDGVSRIGYARSDGERIIERDPYPVLALQSSPRFRGHRLREHPGLVASGGSWSGTEDPRAVILDGRLYLSFSAFSGWDSIRMTVMSVPLEDLEKRTWRWSRPIFLSKPREVNKNWVIFPERVNGKIAVLHSLNGGSHDRVEIAYLDTLDEEPKEYIESPFVHMRAPGRWDYAVRGAGSPPVLTEHGWLLFYHATSEDEGHRYKIGALLLDRKDPSHIIARSGLPLLAPDEWYENEGAKAGVVYVCGATLDGDDIRLYYGGADSHVCSAHLSLTQVMRELVS